MLPKGCEKTLLALSLLITSAIFVGGCQQGEGDGLTTEQVQLGQKSDEIIKAAKGSWDNLSPEDKEYLIKEIGYGDERNARMFFNAKSGNLRSSGPPKVPGGLATGP
jgi:hypothetical protein